MAAKPGAEHGKREVELSGELKEKVWNQRGVVKREMNRQDNAAISFLKLIFSESARLIPALLFPAFRPVQVEPDVQHDNGGFPKR